MGCQITVDLNSPSDKNTTTESQQTTEQDDEDFSTESSEQTEYDHENSQQPEQENSHADDGESSTIVQASEYAHLPFDERLVAQGYTPLLLPADFPFQLPYHFIPVKAEINGEQGTEFTSTFCYDLPLTVDEVAVAVDELNDLDITVATPAKGFEYETTFSGTGDQSSLNGSFAYYIDDYDNSCVTLQLSSDHSLFAEDAALITVDEHLNKVVKNRPRVAVDDYETYFWEYLGRMDDAVDIDIDSPEIESIVEKIQAKTYEMTHLSHRTPQIFPYEWYLMRTEDDATEDHWSGTFCTDTSILEALENHHQRLENYHADIVDYMINASPKMNQKSFVEFAFNDISGEGSWHGRTVFFIDRLNFYQIHKCMLASLEFSPEIID